MVSNNLSNSIEKGYVTSIYYYFNIVKMAASTVEMAAAIFIPPPVLFDRW